LGIAIKGGNLTVPPAFCALNSADARFNHLSPPANPVKGLQPVETLIH
jgi:hypothetical protein